jgi:low affinity Fe/Cu permease
MSASRTFRPKQKPPSSSSKLRFKQREEPAVEVQTRVTNDRFGRLSAAASAWLGSKWAFSGAVLVIVIWAASGFAFHYSDTWQLVINTGTTIVTFLMVFLIQNTQNRDARAINLKLNELIHAQDKARDQMIDIENLSDLELDELQSRYEVLRKEYMAREELKKRGGAT